MSKEKYLAALAPGLVSLLLISYGLAVQYFIYANFSMIEHCGFNRCLLTRSLYWLFDRSVANQIIGNLCIYFGILLAYFTIRKLIKKPILENSPQQ